MYKSVHESMCVCTQDCQEKVDVCTLRYAYKRGTCTNVWESLVGGHVCIPGAGEALGQP